VFAQHKNTRRGNKGEEEECCSIPPPRGLTRNTDELRRLGWNGQEEGNRGDASESEAARESGGSGEGE